MAQVTSFEQGRARVGSRTPRKVDLGYGRGFQDAGPRRAKLERGDFGDRGMLRTRETQGRRA